MRPQIFVIFFFLISSTYAQHEDFEYELKHKSQAWFSNMKDGSNYFDVKRQFDLYFGKHQWEKSKPRSLGES